MLGTGSVYPYYVSILRLIAVTTLLTLFMNAQAFRAGVGKAEITPPPGWPTGGHGPAGSIARGYWNRLYARAFYIEDAQKQSIVLVSCDMFAVPLGLRAAVWNQVKAVPNLKADRLIIAATHTHQGPGNYLSAQVYNEFGSSASGFSKPLFDYL